VPPGKSRKGRPTLRAKVARLEAAVARLTAEVVLARWEVEEVRKQRRKDIERLCGREEDRKARDRERKKGVSEPREGKPVGPAISERDERIVLSYEDKCRTMKRGEAWAAVADEEGMTLTAVRRVLERRKRQGFTYERLPSNR